MFNRLFSALGLARPDPRRMPQSFGSLRIRPRLGVSTRAYFKFLKKHVCPYLTKEDEKVLRAHYKSLQPGNVGWIRMMVSEKTYNRKFDKLKDRITIERGEDINCECNGRFFKGCCNGPQVGKEENLEKSYYIKEFLGEAEWPSPNNQHVMTFAEEIW